MFSKFNLKGITETNGIFNDYYSQGKRLYDLDKEKISTGLKEFIRSDGTIDGSSLQNLWFPNNDKKFDVFLSHSHADKELAIQISGWLKEEFGINTFIDSCLWGYANDLLKEIDDEYCKNLSNENYSYEKRNYSTSHVHMMLSIALSKVIDNTECVMFINTPKSVSWEDEFEKSTISPWIYHELAMTSVIRQTPLDKYRESYRIRHSQNEEVLFEAVENEIKITYQVDKYIKNLTDLDINDLENWHMECRKGRHKYPLNELYKIRGLLKNASFSSW